MPSNQVRMERMKTNIDNFFKDENRSMMGGWTIDGRKKAIEEALALEGDEKVEALLEVINRLTRDEEGKSPSDNQED